MNELRNADFIFKGFDSLNRNRQINMGTMKPHIDAYIQAMQDPKNYLNPWMLKIYEHERPISSCYDFSDILNSIAYRKMKNCNVSYSNIKSRNGHLIENCMYYAVKDGAGDLRIFLTKDGWREVYFIYFPTLAESRSYFFPAY